MKSLIVMLAIIIQTLTLNMQAQSSQLQNEIKTTIEALMQCSIEKDFEKAISYWHNGDQFRFISDGESLSYEDLKHLYKDFFHNLEYIKVLENKVTTYPLSNYKALCIWEGIEKYKMIDSEELESKWISSLVMENKKGKWIILHAHTSHL